MAARAPVRREIGRGDGLGRLSALSSPSSSLFYTTVFCVSVSLSPYLASRKTVEPAAHNISALVINKRRKRSGPVFIGPKRKPYRALGTTLVSSSHHICSSCTQVSNQKRLNNIVKRQKKKKTTRKLSLFFCRDFFFIFPNLLRVGFSPNSPQFQFCLTGLDPLKPRRPRPQRRSIYRGGFSLLEHAPPVINRVFFRGVTVANCFFL